MQNYKNDKDFISKPMNSKFLFWSFLSEPLKGLNYVKKVW